jgi:transcriptional regulator with XRE-family HTH domain
VTAPDSSGDEPQPRTPEHGALGRAVRELRARRGHSQETLGFASGLHRNYVGAIERGEINPTFRVLLQVSEDGLDIPIEDTMKVYRRQLREPPPPRRRHRSRRRAPEEPTNNFEGGADEPSS